MVNQIFEKTLEELRSMNLGKIRDLDKQDINNLNEIQLILQDLMKLISIKNTNYYLKELSFNKQTLREKIIGIFEKEDKELTIKYFEKELDVEYYLLKRYFEKYKKEGLIENTGKKHRTYSLWRLKK